MASKFRELVRMGEQRGVPSTYRATEKQYNTGLNRYERAQKIMQYIGEHQDQEVRLHEIDAMYQWPNGTSAHICRDLLRAGWITRHRTDKNATGALNVYHVHDAPVPKSERTPATRRRHPQSLVRPSLKAQEQRLQQIHDQAAPAPAPVAKPVDTDKVVLAKLIENVAWDYMMSLEPSEYKLHTLVLKDLGDWLRGKERKNGSETETSSRPEYSGSTVGNESLSQ